MDVNVLYIGNTMRIAVSGVSTVSGPVSGATGTVAITDSLGGDVWSGVLAEDSPGEYSALIPANLDVAAGDELEVLVSIDFGQLKFSTAFTLDVWRRYD